MVEQDGVLISTGNKDEEYWVHFEVIAASNIRVFFNYELSVDPNYDISYNNPWCDWYNSGSGYLSIHNENGVNYIDLQAGQRFIIRGYSPMGCASQLVISNFAICYLD